ncbi:MAG: hypothetical protein AAF799_32705 [Myxococcota bacterium]
MGKTTLGREFARQAQRAGFATAWVDAAIVEPTPDAIERAWLDSLDTSSLHPLERPTVLFLDGFEHVERIEGWFRERLMEQAGPHARLVLLGRRPLSPWWTTSWAETDRVRTTALSSFDPEEARHFLVHTRIEAADHDAAIEASHGHPLALALLAEAHARDPSPGCSTLAEHPSLVAHLVDRLCGTVQRPLERHALAVLAEARVTTQSLLERMLRLDDGFEVFRWLRELSFVSSHPQGLVPHALVRDLLLHEVGWRDPDRAHDLRQRLRTYYVEGFETAAARGRELDALRDLAHLYRNHPPLRGMFAFEPQATLYPEVGTDADLPAVASMLTAHGLGEALPWLDDWRARPEGSLVVMRNRRREIVGMELSLRVTDQTLAEAEAHDPAAGPLRRALERRDPLRPGEYAMVGRLWCTHEGQKVNEVQSQLWLNRVRECVRDGHVAHMVAYFAEPNTWSPAFSFMGFERCPDADFRGRDHSYGAFIRDFRHESSAQWLMRLTGLVTGQHLLVERPAPRPSRVVLSEDDFAEAVKTALRSYPARNELAANPLAGSRLVVRRRRRAEVDAESHADGEMLAQLIEEACDSVRTTPVTRKAYRALYRSFVNPARTQREAAELESMPFGTFRRQLATGIERVTAYLWRLETHERPEHRVGHSGS